MLKKIFSILFIFLLFVLVVGALWFFFLRGEETTDGSLKEASPFGKFLGEIVDFSRFGFGDKNKTAGEDTADTDEDSGDGTRGGGLGALTPLRQISSVPVSGAFASSSPEGNIEIFYMEQASGHIYKATGDSALKERVTNTTITGVREAIWGSGGDTLILRYLEDNDVIKSYKAKIGEGSEERKLDGYFLFDDIFQIVSSPSKNNYFTLSPLETSAVGTVSDFANGKNQEIFTSSFTDWSVLWPEENTLAFTTKASAEAPGFLYFLNTKSKAFTKVFGGVLGMTTLISPDLEFVLFSETTQGGFLTKIHNTKTKQVVDFSLETLPEKCVWSAILPATIYCGAPQEPPVGAYPDSWYQGRSSFADDVWVVDVETGVVKVLALPSIVAKQEIDLTNPMLDLNENYLIFTNKKDGTLWALKVNG